MELPQRGEKAKPKTKVPAHCEAQQEVGESAPKERTAATEIDFF